MKGKLVCKLTYSEIWMQCHSHHEGNYQEKYEIYFVWPSSVTTAATFVMTGANIIMICFILAADASVGEGSEKKNW